MNKTASLKNNGLPFAGRGDLLRFLERHGEQGLDAMAEFAGYQRIERVREEEKERLFSFQPQESAPIKVEHRFIDPVETKHFWYVASQQVIKEEDARDRKPEWAKTLEKNPVFLENQVRENYEVQRPLPIPLVPWSRVWPLLRGALGTDRKSRDIEMRRLIEKVSKLQPLKQIPFKSRFGWDATGCLILDLDDRLLPVWGDVNRLHKGIEKLRGRSGLSVYMVESGPEGPVRKRDMHFDPVAEFRLPEPGTPMVIASDLGYLELTGTLKKQWLRLGRKLNRAGIAPVVLTPCPPSLWDEDLARYYLPVWWDRGNRSFRKNPKRPYVSGPSDNYLEDRILKAERLLMLLSPAIRVEPELLRALRMTFSCAEADASTEILAWNHLSVERSYIAYIYDTGAAVKYRADFKKEPEHIRSKVIELINVYHAHLSDAVRCEEMLIAGELDGRTPEWTDVFMKTFFRTIGDYKRFQSQENLESWFRRFTSRQHKEVWQGSDVLAACWLKINMEGWENETEVPPEGTDISKVLWLISDKKEPETYVIRQKGEQLVVTGAGSPAPSSDAPFETGSHVAYVESRKSCLTITSGSNTRTVHIPDDTEIEVPLTPPGPLILTTDMTEITLLSTVKPRRASVIGRDSQGLYVKMGDPDKAPRIDWPEWSDQMGSDDFGLYAEFKVAGITQRMRWINPGVFLMGSPENEPERDDDERLHQVTLTQGFWLADTACTQALWEAVMGGNPSDFKGPYRPVENVSWEDSMEFIRKLNSLKQGLDLRLPTEAEWEYACRAGATTPFSFGNTITSDQVNYDGNFPYAGEKKGKYREETVEVKSMPANSWGLYEMHGNVWEWCADWYGEYPEGKVVDPIGLDKGGVRVLRGGSWGSYGGFVRSAGRLRYEPGDRLRYIGFRLARGQEPGEEKAGRRAGQTERSEVGQARRKNGESRKEKL